jgi:hypothetical protein
VDEVSPLSSHISHLTQHTHFLWIFGFGYTAAHFFFYSKRKPATWRFPARLFSRSPLFLFLLHCIGPVWAPLASWRAFLPPPAMLSRSLVFSALLSYLSYSQASDVRTRPPSGGAKGVWSKSSWPRARGFAFVLFCFGIGTLFLSHRFLLTGLIPARGMGWLWVPLDGIFFAFAPLGLFGMCVISERVCGICMNKGLKEVW